MSQKIKIRVQLGEQVIEEEYDHFTLVGITSIEGNASEDSAQLLQSTSHPMIAARAIKVIATQLTQHEAADAQIVGKAVVRTIDTALERLHGMRATTEPVSDEG